MYISGSFNTYRGTEVDRGFAGGGITSGRSDATVIPAVAYFRKRSSEFQGEKYAVTRRRLTDHRPSAALKCISMSILARSISYVFHEIILGRLFNF